MKAGPHQVLALVFLGILSAPHATRPLVERWRRADAEAPRPNWAARKPPVVENSPAFGFVLDGRWARQWEGVVDEAPYCRLLRALGNEALYALFGQPSPRLIAGDDGQWFLASSLRGLDPGVANSAQAIRRRHECAETLHVVRTWLAERGVRLVVAPIPRKVSLYPESISRGRRARRAAGEEDASYQQLLADLEARDLPVVNVRAALQALQRGGVEPFFARDTHMNSAGIRALGQALSRRLRELEPAFTTRQPDPSQRVVMTPREHRVDSYVAMGFRRSPIFEADFRVPEDIVHFPDARVNEPEAAELAVAGTSFGALYGPRFAARANLARVLAHELDTTVADYCIYAGGATRGLVQLLDQLDQLPRLRVVAVEFPVRYLGNSAWRTLARAMAERTGDWPAWLPKQALNPKEPPRAE